MLDRFTDRSRRVLQLAREEAGRLNHEYVGTEHLLLGLLAEGQGVASRVLRQLGLDLQKVRETVEALVKPGVPGTELPDKVIITPRAKKALDAAQEMARELGHDYVGTEHLLLGLLHEGQGVAARALGELGLDLETVRNATLAVLGASLPGGHPGVSAGADEEVEEPVPVPQREIPWPEWVKEAVNAPEVIQLERRAIEVRTEKEAAVQRQDFETAAKKRDEERALRAELPRRASLRSLRLLLDRPEDPARKALEEVGLDLEALRRHLDRLLEQPPPEPVGE